MIFARGALKAALWARGRPPGLYSMADVTERVGYRRKQCCITTASCMLHSAKQYVGR